MKALRLPVHALLLPYGFGCRPHRLPPLFVLAEALLISMEGAYQAWTIVQPAVPFRHCRLWT
jgi:hypothetical protein